MDSKVIGLLRWVVGLLALNLVVIAVTAAVLILGLTPKAERGVQVAERMEERFQGIADHVEPVVMAGAGKTIQAIQNMDASQIADHATDGVSGVVDSAAERARDYLNNKKQKKEGQTDE